VLAQRHSAKNEKEKRAMDKNFDYERLSEIVVKSQEEFDMIPDNYSGRIYVEFGTVWNRAIVNRRFAKRVVAYENSSVVAYGNSSVEAYGNSSVEAYENSSVVAHGNSSVVAYENSSVEAYENSSVVAYGNSSVVAYGNSSVVAHGNSSVEAHENSSVVAHENSSVVAYGNSSVVAYGNSSVVAHGNSSVEGSGNAQIVDCQDCPLPNARIEITGNARIVYNPKTIHEYLDFFGIKHDKKTAVLYKAVHKTLPATAELYADQQMLDSILQYKYCSDRDADFQYYIGKIIHENCNPDTEEDCSYGIHISHLAWALNFGCNWSDLAILEVEADIDKIVLPKRGNGKVRTSEVKVLREIPLEECGIYGKILARRREQNS
jgi:hypothetical protein